MCVQTKDVYGGTFLYHLGEGEPLIVVGAVVSDASCALLESRFCGRILRQDWLVLLFLTLEFQPEYNLTGN